MPPRLLGRPPCNQLAPRHVPCIDACSPLPPPSRGRCMVATRAYWKGYLKLSLVSCPVQLFPASSTAEKDRVALARIVMANREHVIAIEPFGKGMLGTTLRYPYEVRDESAYFREAGAPRATREMVELAEHILATKEARFDPSRFKDEY